MSIVITAVDKECNKAIAWVEVPTDTVVKSFTKCGISNSLGDWEDDYFEILMMTRSIHQLRSIPVIVTKVLYVY
jgi:hypothetical protein